MYVRRCGIPWNTTVLYFSFLLWKNLKCIHMVKLKIMQNKCIFLKDPFQSTAYRCTEVRLCILNLHGLKKKKKITEKNIAMPALSAVSTSKWMCRCTGYFSRSRRMFALFLFLPASSQSSQHTGLILYLRKREKKELYKLCQITLIHWKGHKLILSFWRLRARYLWASILGALISFLNWETFINLGH